MIDLTKFEQDCRASVEAQAAATEGPWKRDIGHRGQLTTIIVRWVNMGIEPQFIARTMTAGNAELMVEARNSTVPAAALELLAEHRKLVEGLRALCDHPIMLDTGFVVVDVRAIEQLLGAKP